MTITVNHIAEFLALLTSILFWKYLKKGSFRWLPFFLFFILCVELIGKYLQKVMYANIILYNFSIPLEYLFYLFLFYLHGKQKLKSLSGLCSIILFIVSLYYLIATPLKAFHSYVLVTGQIAVIIAGCFFIYECFMDNTEDSILKKPFFWLCSGLLLFNLGELTYTLLYPLVNKNGWDKFDTMFKAVNNNLLLLLYLSYIIAINIYRRNVLENARKF
jgi:hypothetical protein